MDQKSFGTLMRNLGVLLGIALPAAVLVMFVNYRWIVKHPGAWSLADVILVYVTAFLPLAFGGLIHQAVLWKARAHRHARTLAIVTSPVVLVFYFVGLAAPGFLLENILAIVTGLAISAVLVRPLSTQDSRGSMASGPGSPD